MSEDSIFDLPETPDLTGVAVVEEPARSKEERQAEYDARHDVAMEDTTCWRCSDSKTCEVAWDPYNTDGDCLMDK